MNPLKVITDGYDRKARLYPALVLLLPAVMTGSAILSVKLSSIQTLGATAAGCGGAFLLSQLARDAGKRCEERLFARWGGMPSVAILRHRDTRLDAVTKARYHKNLASLVKGTKPPSPEQERANPALADQTYAAWSTYLRTHTRDTKKHPLIFAENMSYGYRRNIWGLRPFGVAVAGICSAISIGWTYYRYLVIGAASVPNLGALALSLALLGLWLFHFSADWVRIPADAYAARLVESVEVMTSKGPPTKGAINKGRKPSA